MIVLIEVVVVVVIVLGVIVVVARIVIVVGLCTIWWEYPRLACCSDSFAAVRFLAIFRPAARNAVGKFVNAVSAHGCDA